MNVKVVAKNRKAKHDFFLLETYEAGLVLQGSEIKSIRAGQVSIKEAYVRTDGKEAWLVDAHIAPPTTLPAVRTTTRSGTANFCCTAKKLENYGMKSAKKASPSSRCSIYLKNGRAKLEIALAKGKRKYDKRQDLARQRRPA